MTPISPLFVPATRPDLLPKALAGEADAVIVDLEDAVAPSAREQARAGLAALLPSRPAVPVAVRVNGPRTAEFARDLAALEPLLDRVAFVVAPMTGTAEDVAATDRALSAAERAAGSERCVPLVPMVETAEGVLEARSLAAASRRVLTLAFGPADLASQLGADADGAFLTARSLLVLACAAAGVAPPLDGPHLDLSDAEGLAASAEAARGLGFGGKLAIHPGQVAAVRECFAPSAADLAWARAVDRAFTEAEAAGSAAIRLEDGTFVDPPVARRARALLARGA
ncbi:HpcH/HpaI aldolase/citrate lyase family protein [Nocardiopsis potens]|uniref:HpcH/HpaI aldolase/citrate lyase family protein n=1 Tax=Nocardiopsis potens TaxID=1246458 RepID=UPI00034CEE2C|nr:CoA ester lyase [Nocardiopsis potens]